VKAALAPQSLANGTTLNRDIARRHARSIRVAGLTIILLSAGAALLPLLGGVPGTWAVGVLLITAGAIELFAGTLRHETRSLAMLAGAVTAFAGVLFAFNSSGELLPSVTVVTAWLLARSAILFVTSRRAHGSVRTWLGLAAATDFGLGVVLLTGLSITTLVVMLFDAMPQLVSGFAWVLALSFVATGTLLLQVANSEQEPLT
jgi:uncharacterized membrane protein HdeD (DUF308 family)